MFYRKINLLTKKLLNLQYGKLVNTNNILKISRFKIKKIFKDEDPKIKNIYLHNIISEWLAEQEEQNNEIFLALKALIRKTKIDINNEEKHDLFLLEERIFSKDRHIKIIEANYNLTPKEKVGVKFMQAKLYKREENVFKTILKDNLLISNRRIIFPRNNVSYKFSEIKSYWYKKYGFEFNVGNEFLVVRIHDQETLNNTIENIIHRKVKNAIKKRKNN